MKKNLFKKVITSTLLLNILFCNITQASVFSDVMNFFGINDTQEYNNSHISKELYDSLNNEEKEVAIVIDNIYNDVKNLNIDGVVSHIDVSNYISDVEYIKKLIDDNSIIATSVKTLLKGLNYKIISMGMIGEKVVADIEYKCEGVMSLFIKDTDKYKFTFIKNPDGVWKLNLSDEIIAFINTVWEQLNK